MHTCTPIAFHCIVYPKFASATTETRNFGACGGLLVVTKGIFRIQQALLLSGSAFHSIGMVTGAAVPRVHTHVACCGTNGTFPATQSFHMAMITDLQCYLVCGFVHGFALHRALCQFFGACGALARCLRHATTVEGFGEGRAKMDVKYLHIRAAVRAGDLPRGLPWLHNRAKCTRTFVLYCFRGLCPVV